jgi:AbrB family looped-hinge helix DNA binding protein
MRNKVSISNEIIVQKQRSRTYKGTTYLRYRVTIPTHIAEQLNLKGGERVDVILTKKTIVISFD